MFDLFSPLHSVLGMHLFGGKFCTDATGRQCTCDEIKTIPCKCERKNFDTLLWSLVTVFQVSYRLSSLMMKTTIHAWKVSCRVYSPALQKNE